MKYIKESKTVLGGVQYEVTVPTVVDRVVQQATTQILSPIFEPQFSETSYGFRSKRSVHDALKKCKEYASQGYTYVVDIDLEKFFDTVNQSKMIEILSRTIKDGRVISLIQGKQGYQMSAAFYGDTGETVTMYLDPGNTNSIKRLKDMLEDISAKYSRAVTNNLLILRSDIGYGSGEGVEMLKATKFKFVFKGYSSKMAKNFASKVNTHDWEEIDEYVDVCELPPQDTLRIILVRILKKDGVKHTYLATNIPASDMSAQQIYSIFTIARKQLKHL